MSAGTVRSFDSTKGYGFIRPDDGSRDVFVAAATEVLSGMAALDAGQKLSYLLRRDPRTRKIAAISLRARASTGMAVVRSNCRLAIVPSQPGDQFWP